MISDRVVAVWAVVALACSAAIAGAQQAEAPAPKTAKPKAQAIEIRGQVPTPQVVTVRPRQIPMFPHEVLTPAFFDRRFFEAVVAPYEIVPDLSVAAGAVPLSSTVPALPADSGHRPPPVDSSGRSSSPAGPPTPSPGASRSPNDGDALQGQTPNAPREK